MTPSRAERAIVTDWWLTVDKTLLGLVLALAICGAMASVVATPQAAIHFKLEPFYFARRHVLAMPFAVVLAVAVSFLNPVQIRRLAAVLFLGGIALMAAALLQGIERNGAVRWLIFGGAVIQPSEFMKPGFVVMSAWFLSESMEKKPIPALEFAVLTLVIALTLLVLQPDMGQAIIVSAVWGSLFFLAGYPLQLVPLFAGAGAGALVAAYYGLPHFAARIDRFAGSLGDAQQTAVASSVFREAGWLGHGFGEGFARLRLPDSHNDYVFAAIAEELGIAACLFVILIYGLIVWRGLTGALRGESGFLRLSAFGLITIFGMQALINMAVNLNVLPAKGVTLPFVSYGRSSLFSSAITLGMVLATTKRGTTGGGNDHGPLRPQPVRAASTRDVENYACAKTGRQS